MYAYDTGEQKVVHIPGLDVETSQDIGEVLHAVRLYGHGSGDITLQVENGVLRCIHVLFKRFRDHVRKRLVN